MEGDDLRSDDAMTHPSAPLEPLCSDDGRLSAAALEIQRGVIRTMARLGLAAVTELPLPNGRRADVVALSPAGDLTIVEIKSCLEDFRTDAKWPEYRDYSDRLLFAVGPSFPRDILPPDAGLIVADRYGGEVLREAPLTRLTGARRKVMMLRFARSAAFRLAWIADPDPEGRIDPAGY